MGGALLSSLVPFFVVAIAGTLLMVGAMAAMANKGSLSGGFTIRAFVGANGHGKTWGLIEVEVEPAFRAGVPVVSNLRLYPPDPVVGVDEDGIPIASFVALSDWRQLLRVGVHRKEQCDRHGGGVCALRELDGEPIGCEHEAWADRPLYSITGNRGCVVVLDEINRVLPSRQFASMPGALMGLLNQLRKLDVRLVWSAPNWARADVVLREVTQAVTVCEGSFPDPYRRDRSVPRRKFALNHRRYRDPVTGLPVRLTDGWLPNRLFKFATYDAVLMDDFTYQQAKKIKPFGFKYLWRPFRSSDLLYDTREHVGKLSHVDAFGTCVVCDGKKSQPACSCGRGTGAGMAARARRASVPREVWS